MREKIIARTIMTIGAFLTGYLSNKRKVTLQNLEKNVRVACVLYTQ